MHRVLPGVTSSTIVESGVVCVQRPAQLQQFQQSSQQQFQQQQLQQ